jgi:hypothetical protein
MSTACSPEPVILTLPPRHDDEPTFRDLMSWLRGGFVPRDELGEITKEIARRKKRPQVLLPFVRRASR